MRTVATILLGALATIAFWIFFGLSGVASYVTDASAVTGTARDHDLHGWVLRAADEALAEEMRTAVQPDTRPQDTAYRALVLSHTRQAFARAFTQEWLYHAFAAAYGDIIAILEGDDSTRTTGIDLGPQKAQLEASLSAIGEHIEAQCDQLFGPERCTDQASRRRAVQPLRLAMASTVVQIPDHVDIVQVITRAHKNWLQPDSPKLQRARQVLELSRMARYVAAAILLVLLLVLALLHAPLTRAIVVVGAVLVIASASYLIGVRIADSVPERVLSERRVRERMSTEVREDAVGDLAAKGAETLVLAALDDAVHASDATVLAVLIASLGATTGAAILRRRR
jgi:uncharacterized membrane protein YecN with MAPEG domain